MTRDRILIVDDQQGIHGDFARLLAPAAPAASDSLDCLAALLGGGAPEPAPAAPAVYELVHATQGLEAVALHAAAVAAGAPPAVAFVDVRMPPGIDGVETVRRLWAAQPDLEIVLCTAFSDYAWHELLERLPARDRFVILRKPFEPIEVRQLAAGLTEKWRRGRELARQMEALEGQVRSEVARRLQAELAHVQKFEMLGRLAAGIAHEINTPIQYIATSVEYVQELLGDVALALAGPQPDPAAIARILAEAPAALTDAQHGVRRVTAIVRSVREYAHTNESRELEEVDVDAQLRMVAELTRAQYKADADVVLELTGDAFVPGRADDLGRAFLNLAVNAAQAIAATRARRERGKITLRSRMCQDAVVVEVTDTGGGIPREHWGRVFDPYFTTKPRGQGTGQGLAMVRATVVEVHHGHLTFESEPGVGTTFRITLPREQQMGAVA